MRWFLDLSTRGKLYVSFGLMVVLLAAVAAAAYRSVALIRDSQKALYEDEFTDVLDIKEVRANQIANRADMLSMMVPGSRAEVAALEKAIRGRVDRTDESMRRLLKRNQTDPGNLKRLQEFESLRRTSLQTRESETLPLIRAGKLEEARQLHLGIQAERDAQLEAIADAFLAQTEQAARAALERSALAARDSVRVFLVAGIIAVLLAVAMTLLLNRVIAEPLKELSAAAERVAAGDLSVDVPADGRADETGTLLQTFARMLASLRETTRDLSTEKRLLHNLMDSIPDAIFFKDREHRFLRINRVHAAILGVPRPEDAVGRPTSDFFPPDEARQRDAEDDEIVRGGKPLPDKVRRISQPGGKVRWSSTTKAPIKDENGQVTGLVGIARNITERQRLQEELGEREAGLRRAQLMAKLAHVITRPDGSFESWSETLPQLIGADSAGMPQSTREWLNVVHPDDKQKFREKAIETGATGERFDLEYRLRRADGAWIDVRQVSEPMMPGGPDAEGRVRWFGTLQDVTEQKQADEKLRASESLKGAVLESSLDCIVTMDHEGKIVEFNPAAERTFGHTRKQAIGSSMAELIIPPRLRDAHHRGLAHYLATGEGPVLGRRLELEAIRADGTEFPIELAITSIKSGATPLFTGFIRDITPRREAEAKINRLNRVYAVLSGINAAIVHTRDRQELFREVCRIAIDSGRFRMVWFGLLDKERERVMPVASAGDVRGFLDAASTAVTHVKPGGLGLTGRAIREMKPMVSNDIQNDPQRTMKEEFRERGINSLAVLPLIIGNEAVGVVNLYAADVGFFDEEEMRLLHELAGDISFALDNIDKQEKLRRLTRVNEMLSSINGAIVRIRDRLELYQEACRIAVETGGLRFAWLCVVDEDEMRLKPVASAGADDRYLDLIRGRLSLRDDAPEGHGIAAKAVREKRSLVVNDAQSDPKVLFKKEHAARGIRSMAVLPLSVGGKVVGTFGLHSGEVGFFDDQETKLIDEIAGNIAFALDHIEKEEKVERLNRVYSVLSGINTLIVRERDREQLFREACRIAVEAGKLRFVWIGVVDHEAMQLTPVAWAGEEQDFLAAVRSRLSLSESDSQARSLVAQAAVAKEALISNDVANDPRIRFKQEHAQRGIRSLAAFPLMLSDKVVGVVALHAAEVGFFDHEEVRLLTELVGDISFGLEHIDKEQKLERLNRVYAVLSGINTMIVRVRDRDELFRESCRIAIELGRFRLVYVALVDDAAQQIVPIAWAGDHPDLAQRRRPLGPSGPGREGTGSLAIRSKRPVVENNITADSRTLTYPEEVLKRGYRSVGSFPLVVGEKAVGVLGLFAGEPGYFDAQEIKLLEELAGDIAFALEHIEKEEKLDYLAYYDSITGLANRTFFHERLEQYVREAGRTQRRFAVLVVDIERFRTINDTLGRQAGDALLKQMAARFLDLVAEPGEVARLGADHFAVVIPDVKLEADLARIVEKARERILGEPFSVAGTELRIATKAGIAVFPSDGADAETLLRNAEAALQKAKASGERHVFYTQQMNERVAEKLTLENKLRQALEKNEFVLHYQPKVDLEKRAIVGVEALIRWQSPELGLVPPGKFISLLEETGLILQVGSWALRRAALDHRSWVEQKLKAPRVAVNVSQIQLRQRDFVAVVEQAIIDGLAPTAIDLEITESLIMEDVQANIAKLRAVRDLGMKIAIDDFGTGYSSLGYLAQLPVESLKIDRSFIVAMHSDPNATTLVSTIISLARSLRLKVVAEGVETEEQAKLLRLLRCDEMQGYLFSKPLPIDALVELLRKAS